MSKTIKYTGVAPVYAELPVTGKPSSWLRNQVETRSDTEADLLLATGLFAQITLPGVGVTGVSVSGALKITGPATAPTITLPAATTTEAGSMTPAQVLALAAVGPLEIATASKLGGVKPSASVSIDAATGVASIPAAVLAAAGPIDTVEALAFPTNLIAPAINMGEAVTLKGRMLRKTYIGNNDENSFGYYPDRPQSFPAEGVSTPGTLNNSNTARVQIGKLVVPGNLGNVSPTGIDATITVTANAPITAGRIALALGKYRTDEKYIIEKLWTTTQGTSVTMQVRLLPIHPSVVKLSQLAADTAPTKYPQPSMKAELNTLGNVELPIFFQFATPGVPTATCVITGLTANAVVTPPAKFKQVSGKAYRHVSAFPFPSVDPMNSPLLSTTSCTGVAFTHNPATASGTVNATGTTGSATLTLFTTAKLKVGMIPQIMGVTYRHEVSEAGCGYPSNAFNVDTSRQTFGAGCKIISIDSATQVTLNQPLLKDVSMVGKDQYGNINTILFFANAETLCAQAGDQANSMRINPITGITKLGTGGNNQKAIPYPNSFPILQSSPTDPLRSVVVTRLVAPNGWAYSVDGATNVDGESYTNVNFQVRIPAYFDSAYLNAYNNADRNLSLKMEDGQTVLELYYCTYNDTTKTLTAARAVMINGNGPSIPYIYDRPEFLGFNNDYDGISYGTRAWGGGLTNGIIRWEEWNTIPATPVVRELDSVIDANIELSWNAINHPVAMVFSGTQLKSDKFCPDPAVQTNKVNYKSFISNFEHHTPGIGQPGINFAVGDVVTSLPGNWEVPVRLVVTAISGGGATGPIAAWTLATVGQYRVAPTDAEAAAAATMTNNAGSGCVINFLALAGDATITTAAQAFPDSARNSMWVFPGTTVDNKYRDNYSGVVPMSTTYSTDSRFTVASLKAEQKWRRQNRPADKLSSYEFFAVVAAIYKYGAPVLDLSEGTHNLVVVDDRVARSANYSNLHGDTGGQVYPNYRELKTKLALVENVTVKGKGGVGSTPRPGSAFAPDLFPINN